MIRGKPPIPFQTIALAVSFNPGLPVLVRETRRLAEKHGAVSVFIHVGKKTGEKQRELSSLLVSSGFHDGNSRIYWESGDVVQNIMRICKHEVVDLLLLGASEKNNFSLPVGRNTRSLSTRAKCSMLIYASHPEPSETERLVVYSNDPRKEEHTLMAASYMADIDQARQITLIHDISPDPSVKEHADSGTGAARTRIVSSTLKNPGISVLEDSLTGFDGIADYAFKNQTDLLITHSSDHRLLIFDRLAGEGSIETLIGKIPCNLLIVHSRISEL